MMIAEGFHMTLLYGFIFGSFGLHVVIVALSLISMFQNCVMLRCGLWLFRSWCKSFLSVPAGTRSKTWPRRPRAGF